MAGPAQALTTRFGAKPVLVTGMSLLVAGCLWYTQIDVDGSYQVDLLPGFLAVGIGIPFSFIPITIAALAGVSHDDAGLASRPHQHVAASRRGDRHRCPLDRCVHASAVLVARAASLAREAVTQGFQWGFWVARRDLGRWAPRRAGLHPPGRGRAARGGRAPRDAGIPVTGSRPSEPSMRPSSIEALGLPLVARSESWLCGERSSDRLGRRIHRLARPLAMHSRPTTTPRRLPRIRGSRTSDDVTTPTATSALDLFGPARSGQRGASSCSRRCFGAATTCAWSRCPGGAGTPRDS